MISLVCGCHSSLEIDTYMASFPELPNFPLLLLVVQGGSGRLAASILTCNPHLVADEACAVGARL